MRTVGVDLGGTNAYAVVLDGEDVIGRAKRRTPQDAGRDGVLSAIEKVVLNALRDADVDGATIAAMGIGTPGIVRGGTVGNSSNVPGFDVRFDLAAELSSRLGFAVRVANDVTAAAVGEYALGAGRGARDLLAVFMGTGVGGGLVLGGVPYEGSAGGAGELGHLVVRQGGAVCPCGRRGCVEAYAGRRAMEQAVELAVAAGRPSVLFDLAASRGKPRVTSGVFKAALEQGDTLVAELLEDAVAALGAGIASAVNLLDLDRVVLGGGLADKLGPELVARVERAMLSHLFLEPPGVALVAASLGDEGGAIGAALLGREVA